MTVTVKVGPHTYRVEVGDLRARPIVVTVEGQSFEVWPEEAQAAPAPPPAAGPAARPAPTKAALPAVNGPGTVRAPIPGVILSVAVQPGAAVTVGQELCVLEAMKMKSAIRAGRAGRVAAVHVSPGQQVAHRQPLLEYVE
jgi:biotin carboxyl carrier protein